MSELYRIRIVAGASGHEAARAAGLHKVMIVFARTATIGLPDGQQRLTTDRRTAV